jgi:hypothetical protein
VDYERTKLRKLERRTLTTNVKNKREETKGHAAIMKYMKYAYKVLVVKPERMLSLGKI